MVLLQCCWSKCITKLIIYDEEPSISLQNVKETAEDCYFLRHCRSASSSFTKSKTPLQVFFHSLHKFSGFLWQRVTVIKLTVFVICLPLSMISIVIFLFKWSVFLVFRREGISYGPDSTRWYHFSHSFS